MRSYALILANAIPFLVFGQSRVENDNSSVRSSSPQSMEITEWTAEDTALASMIIGGCVEISNFQVHGPYNAFGFFEDPTSSIGMENGALLTTGRAILAMGPDDDNNAGLNRGQNGHPSITQLAGVNTFDAVWIEFDFTPLADTIFASDFVFGSEEYPEYVGSPYNDAFGFFISGPGISGPFDGAENIAWLPGTATGVTIANVNNGYSPTEPSTGPCGNCQFYVDNSGGPYVQYDGYTSVIHLEYPVIAGETYHFLIAIADAGDHVYDSGVFIRSESFCGNTWFQTAEFAALPLGNLTYEFQNNSNQADNYVWEFGDGTVSVEASPTHTYSAPGEYEVTLTSTNLCFDTATTVLLNVGTITEIQEQVGISSMVSNIGTDRILVKAELNNSANVHLSIVDMVGKTLWTEQVGTTSRFAETIDISSLPLGMYLMRIDAGRSSSVVRFVRM